MEIRMLHHGDEHRRDTPGHGAVFRFDHLEKQPGAELLQADMGCTQDQGSDGAHRASTRVKEGVGIDPYRLAPHHEALTREACHVRHAEMVEDDALRCSGGPGGELNLSRGRRIDLGEFERDIGAGDEVVPFLEADGLPERRELIQQLPHVLVDPVAAMFRPVEDALRLRLSERMARFGDAEGRVHGYECHTRQSRGEFRGRRTG